MAMHEMTTGQLLQTIILSAISLLFNRVACMRNRDKSHQDYELHSVLLVILISSRDAMMKWDMSLPWTFSHSLHHGLTPYRFGSAVKVLANKISPRFIEV